jgi:agmatine deiminase
MTRARVTVLAGTPAEHGYAFPAEWRRHAATWISWPRPEGISFPGFYHRAIEDVTGVVAAIARHEPVRLNVPNANYERIVRARLEAAGVPRRRLAVFHIPTNECWTRDHGPAFVQRTRRGRTDTAVVDWGFNAWGGKYPPWDADDAVPTRVAQALSLPVFHNPLVMEGGAIDVNGAGTLLATEECLLSDVQSRNPGLGSKGTERVLHDYLGATHVIWLGDGIAGDDTHGHVDDLARFVRPGVVALAAESDPRDANYRALAENRERLQGARDARGRTLEVVPLPMPAPLYFAGTRLPASYLNFLVVNDAVLVPTFNDPKDREALGTLAELFPGRTVVGIHALDLVWGFGTIHCLTQQEPAGALLR